MFKQLYNEISIALDIEPDGPILIKASESGADPTRPDMEFVRTVFQGRETVYIPGSSLKGVLRAHCERLARTVQPEARAEKLDAKRLSCDPLDDKLSCSRQWEPKKQARAKEERASNEREGLATEEIYRESCFVCRLFGNTSLASRLRAEDAYPENPGLVKLEERNGVAIDRVFGSVAVGPFNYETATAGKFKGSIRIRNFTTAQLGLLGLGLRDLAAGRVGVGFGKSRGLGRVRATVNNLSVRYPACEFNGRLTLLGSDQPGTGPDQLAGAGVFPAGKDYGLDSSDVVKLPAGSRLGKDDWGRPGLSLEKSEQITELWKACVQSWQKVIEASTGGA
ncbi:MAG TPA: RAMP superfamily CRISPR-associated protein [Terriglobia bacterium]|nr:RAMP superfamily CRISPR-associated protein [Terriglobia bacterium]